MPEYNRRDWYWLADDGRVYASARNVVVDKTDAGFVARKAEDGHTVTRWPVDEAGAQTIASMQDVMTGSGITVPGSVDLRAYAASARFAKETGGITVGNAPIATDRESQALITSMWAAAQINPAITVQFKSAGGGFATLVAGQIQSIASAVAAHVQACFAAEAQVDAAITAGTVTTSAQVDAAFAAVTA